jgi:NAD(P)-dependent dehydrogenase (short-subunit alcohol dehydrogenase family)
VATAAPPRNGIDFFVNRRRNAADRTAHEVTEEAYDRVLDVTPQAAMFLAQAVARAQIAAGAADVTFICSRCGAAGDARPRLLGVLQQQGRARATGDSSTRVELARHGINVNGVAPTVVRTPMANDWLADAEVYRRLIERIPLGRIAEVDDVSGPVLFFPRRTSAFVTGQILLRRRRHYRLSVTRRGQIAAAGFARPAIWSRLVSGKGFGRPRAFPVERHEARRS